MIMLPHVHGPVADDFSYFQGQPGRGGREGLEGPMGPAGRQGIQGPKVS